MDALTYVGIEQLEMRKPDRPRCGPAEVLLKVDAVGICGSDIGGYLGHHARRQPPLVLGHEAAGSVIETGDLVDDVVVGQRVCVNPLLSCRECDACRSGHPNRCPNWQILGMDRLQGAMAEFVVVPSYAIHPIADSTTSARAACIEPLACAVHLLRLASARSFSSILIVGGGTQGALIAAVARLMGYGPIVVADINPLRLEAVSQLAGVEHTVDVSKQNLEDVVRERVGKDGADIAVDAVGSTTSRREVVRLCRAGGDVLFLGLAEQESQLDVVSLVRREQRLTGSFAYTPSDFSTSQQLIESGKVDLTPWTETFPLSEGARAFRKLTTDPGDTLKIVLAP